MNIESSALLLRRVNYRDSDLVVQLFTEALGKISAIARAARRSKTRFAGTLEALHTLNVELSPNKHGDLLELRSSRLERVRPQLARSLEGMNAAGRALSWVRSAAPERTPEPHIYRGLIACLDALEERGSGVSASQVLAGAGLRLLAAFGWALDFDGCVGCGKACPPNKSARLSPQRGGLLCSSCGHGGVVLSGAQRRTFAAASRGSAVELAAEDAAVALRLVEETLSTHADVA